MQTITRSELQEQLATRKGSAMVSIVSTTEPAWRAKHADTGEPNPHRGQVHKISHVNGVINWRYANAVNNQRVREEQPLDDEGNVEHFEAMPRKWGQRLERIETVTVMVDHPTLVDGSGKPLKVEKQIEVRRLTPLVEHKGRHYLELKVERSLGHEYRDDEGTVYDDDTIHPWLRKRSKSTRQGTEKEIILRDYALDNIDQIRMDGEVYQVID